jgi:hypothetical protein
MEIRQFMKKLTLLMVALMCFACTSFSALHNETNQDTTSSIVETKTIVLSPDSMTTDWYVHGKMKSDWAVRVAIDGSVLWSARPYGITCADGWDFTSPFFVTSCPDTCAGCQGAVITLSGRPPPYTGSWVTLKSTTMNQIITNHECCANQTQCSGVWEAGLVFAPSPCP